LRTTLEVPFQEAMQGRQLSTSVWRVCIKRTDRPASRASAASGGRGTPCEAVAQPVDLFSTIKERPRREALSTTPSRPVAPEQQQPALWTIPRQMPVHSGRRSLESNREATFEVASLHLGAMPRGHAKAVAHDAGIEAESLHIRASRVLCGRVSVSAVDTPSAACSSDATKPLCAMRSHVAPLTALASSHRALPRPPQRQWNHNGVSTPLAPLICGAHVVTPCSCSGSTAAMTCSAGGQPPRSQLPCQCSRHTTHTTSSSASGSTAAMTGSAGGQSSSSASRT